LLLVEPDSEKPTVKNKTAKILRHVLKAISKLLMDKFNEA